jgi:hypothetical protein
VFSLVLLERGAAQQAEPLLRRCVEACPDSILAEGQYWLCADFESALGACLTALSRFDEAESLLLKSYEVIRKAKGDTHIGTQTATRRLARLYDALGNADLADQWRAKLTTPSPPSATDRP